MLNNPLNSSACISTGNQLEEGGMRKIENYEIGGILHTLFIIQPIYGNCDYLTLTRLQFSSECFSGVGGKRTMSGGDETGRERGKMLELESEKNLELDNGGIK
jgi:hypothetical protein